MPNSQAWQASILEVVVEIRDAKLGGSLTVPDDARGIVLFAHGSGSSRMSPRNRYVASVLNQGGLATLLMDLLTDDEEQVDLLTRQHRFDIGLLAGRLTEAVGWLGSRPETSRFPIGTFGSSTGAAAALITAADRPDKVRAVVSRGGRPDLAGDALPGVTAPSLFIVGGYDLQVLELNRQAMALLPPETVRELAIVPGATHLFEEPGTLEQVAILARDWFLSRLA